MNHVQNLIGKMMCALFPRYTMGELVQLLLALKLR